jgi:hypothetical protein
VTSRSVAKATVGSATEAISPSASFTDFMRVLPDYIVIARSYNVIVFSIKPLFSLVAMLFRAV